MTEDLGRAETAVRDLLTVRAQDVPPPLDVYGAVRRRHRRHRLGTALTAAGTVAAVAAAVAVPTVLLRDRAPVPPAGASYTLSWGPGWLPDGVRETERAVTPAGESRRWRGRDEPGLSVQLGVLRDKPVVYAAAREVVTIRGVRGELFSPDPGLEVGLRRLVWREAGRWISVIVGFSRSAPDSGPENAATARRVAESVRPETTPLPVPVSDPDLPGYRRVGTSVFGAPEGSWGAETRYDGPGGARLYLMVEVGSYGGFVVREGGVLCEPPRNGQPEVIGEGMYFPPGPIGLPDQLSAPQLRASPLGSEGPGFDLCSVGGSLTKEQLYAIARGTRVTAPDWLG